MPDIQCLPSHVADLIAAGEVVERPASVAKELLENAIDAGASAIVVEIQHGGLTYLRITDNGCGIDAEQLPTAFLRHATSKLRTAARSDRHRYAGLPGRGAGRHLRRVTGGYLLPADGGGDRGLPASGGRRPRSGGGGGLPGGYHHLRAGTCFTTPPPE